MVGGGAGEGEGPPETPVLTGPLAPVSVTAVNVSSALLLLNRGSRCTSGTSRPSERISSAPCFWTELRAGRPCGCRRQWTRAGALFAPARV